MSTLKILADWDPLCLMSHAPDDEYSTEAEMIEESLLFISSENDLGKKIFEIFKSQFDDDFIKSVEECNEIAKRILKTKGQGSNY